jgi:hypothetical protein
MQCDSIKVNTFLHDENDEVVPNPWDGRDQRGRCRMECRLWQHVAGVDKSEHLDIGWAGLDAN